MEYLRAKVNVGAATSKLEAVKPAAQLLSDNRDCTAMQLKQQSIMRQSSASNRSYNLDSYNTKQIQLKTKIHHSTADFKYAEGKKDKVGISMEAWLDPHDPVVGSETGTPQTELIKAVREKAPSATMVRGHLLNHDLGGYGVADNLYPITTSANGKHKNHVENPVQNELDIAAKETTSEQHNKGQGKGIYYQVEVGNAQLDIDSLVAKPVSFVCTAKKLLNVGPSKNGTQGDTLFTTTVVSDTQGATAPKRGSAHKTGSPSEQPEQMLKDKIVPQGWDHGSRKGTENFSEKVTDGTITTRNPTEIKNITTRISTLQDQLKNLPLDRYSSEYKPAVQNAMNSLASLRAEWKATENSTKNAVASDIMHLIDNYMMKIQGRRPSQAVMLQEMEFTY